jgi:hypothetical protein
MEIDKEELRSAILEFKQLILDEKFFEAHEALEKIWFNRRRERDNLTLTIKGFINSAVSFELYKRGRYRNSRRVFLVYKKLTDRYLDGNLKELKELKFFIDDFAKKLFKLDISRVEF